MSTVSRPPILVTGSHRSGTTWLGDLLSAAPDVAYIDEVFNLDHPMPGACAARFRHQFEYLTTTTGREYVDALANTLRFQFDWMNAARAIATPRLLPRMFENAAAFPRRRGLRPLLKDPLAFFSAEWLEDTFGMRVVVIVRHPGAFAASLDRLGYHFDFRNFLDQPDLMRDHLDPYRAEIQAYADSPPDVIDQAGLLWRCIYGTGERLRQAHPEWLFVLHEELSLQPAEELARICAGLGVEVDDTMRARLAETTSADNPTSAPDHVAHELRRNSAANVHSWRERLTADQVTRLRRAVEPELAPFYAESSWDL